MGIDYRIRVKWDNETKTWQKITEEVSLENTKILEKQNNYTGFFNTNDSMPLRYEVDSFYPNHSCCFVTIPSFNKLSQAIYFGIFCN